MVPPPNPAFVRLSDGKVLGQPVAATALDAIRINTLPAAKPKVLAPKPRIVKVVVPRTAETKKSAQDRSVATDRAGRAGSNRTPSGSQETQPLSPAPRSRSRRSAPGTGRGSAHTRLRVFLVVIAMVVSVFGVRLFQLQGLDPKAYAARAQQAGAATVVLPARRGTILDRKGVALAESVDGLMLIADPKVTTKYGGMIARILADELDLDYFDVRAKLTKSGSRFQYLDRRVPSTLATQVVSRIQARGEEHDHRPRPAQDPVRRRLHRGRPAARLPGQGRRRQPGRLPRRRAAPRWRGLELAFDKRLAGKDGQETYEVGDGNRIPLGDNSTVEPRNGRSLQLTIDRDLQWYVQRVLRSAVQSSRSDSGSAVVIDTQTGEVLSLADFPTYDANTPGTRRARPTSAAGRCRTSTSRARWRRC